MPKISVWMETPFMVIHPLLYDGRWMDWLIGQFVKLVWRQTERGRSWSSFILQGTKEGRWDETAFGVKQWRAACVIKHWVVDKTAHTAYHCFTPNAVSSPPPFFCVKFWIFDALFFAFWAIILRSAKLNQTFYSFLSLFCKTAHYWPQFLTGFVGKTSTIAE